MGSRLLSRSASRQHGGAASLDRRAALQQPERRSEPGLPGRWRHGRPDDGSVATRRKLRDLPEHGVHVQGQGRRCAADRPRAESPLRARGQRPPDGPHRPRQRAAHRRGHRRASVGRADGRRSRDAGDVPGQLRHRESPGEDAQCRARQRRGSPRATREPGCGGPHHAGLVDLECSAAAGRREEIRHGVRRRAANRSGQQSGQGRARARPHAHPPQSLGSRSVPGSSPVPTKPSRGPSLSRPTTPTRTT